MKKFTTIICTLAMLAMLASLTACSSNEKPREEFTDDKEIVVNAPTDSTPESVSDEKGTPESTSNEPSGETEDTSSESDIKENTEIIENKENNEDSGEQTNGAETALPLEQYPDGSYFTYDGKPCTDHDQCSWETECNCVNFDRAIQSMGFAKYVYFQVTGRHVSSENSTEIDEDITGETAKSALMGVPQGTYIAVTQANGVPHHMIAVGTDESSITVYQANYGGGCVVRVSDYTWEDFADRFPHLDNIVK